MTFHNLNGLNDETIFPINFIKPLANFTKPLTIFKLRQGASLSHFMVGWSVHQKKLNLPYCSHFRSDCCQIFYLSLVGAKDISQLKNFKFGFWKLSWIFLKWPFISHFRSDWCQILNLILVGVKVVKQQIFFKCWQPSWILEAILNFLEITIY